MEAGNSVIKVVSVSPIAAGWLGDTLKVGDRAARAQEGQRRS
jgi:hypothetical protein